MNEETKRIKAKYEADRDNFVVFSRANKYSNWKKEAKYPQWVGGDYEYMLVHKNSEHVVNTGE